MLRVNHTGEIIVALAGTSGDIRLIDCGNDVVFIFAQEVYSDVKVRRYALCIF